MLEKLWISQLAEEACPSIQYRLRKEILGQAPADAEMRALQAQILEDKLVREVIGWQQPDGWLAHDFHGYHSAEAGLRILFEKGLAADHPLPSRALEALAAHEERLVRGVGPTVAQVLDEENLGGPQMMRATLFALAGVEDLPIVSAQIQRALAAFEAVLEIDSLGDLIVLYGDKFILKPGSLWPGIYHLRLLAWTHAWRNPRRLQQVAASVQRLVDLSPIPAALVLHKSQLIAPPSFGMQHFNPNLAALADGEWMAWFQRMELLARLGVVARVPQLAAQVDGLRAMLEAGGGRFRPRLSHAYFREWGAYTGLMLERDWRSARRRENDLTFRSRLILHFSQRAGVTF